MRTHVFMHVCEEIQPTHVSPGLFPFPIVLGREAAGGMGDWVGGWALVTRQGPLAPVLPFTKVFRLRHPALRPVSQL